MMQAQIYFDKDELKGSQSLQDFIVEFLIQHKVKGATGFRGQFGFGTNQYLKRPDTLFSFDEPPMMITFVDEDDKVKEVLSALRTEIKGGLIFSIPVHIW